MVGLSGVVEGRRLGDPGGLGLLWPTVEGLEEAEATFSLRWLALEVAIAQIYSLCFNADSYSSGSGDLSEHCILFGILYY